MKVLSAISHCGNQIKSSYMNGYGVCEESINRTFLLLDIGITGRNVNLGDYNLRLLPYKDLPPRSNTYRIQLLCLLCVILVQRF